MTIDEGTCDAAPGAEAEGQKTARSSRGSDRAIEASSHRASLVLYALTKCENDWLRVELLARVMPPLSCAHSRCGDIDFAGAVTYP